MSIAEPTLTIGIEEEYLLVDRESRDLCTDPPAEFLSSCEDLLGGQVTREFLRCQIEIGTPVCQSVQEARDHLSHLRGTIAREAEKYGLAPIAASTHPFANWAQQLNTDRQRYHELAQDYQVLVRRLLICGMHVHVGVEDNDLRIDLYNQLAYFLPHLLALSTSSPFWQGRKSGLKSYRLSVFNELPRTGLPEHFSSWAEYQRTIDVIVSTGVIEDSTKIWWDLRPSARFPTLEMRITDTCTRLDDALMIAAIYRCLARMLWRLRRQNQRWRNYQRALIAENRWLAQRHGASGDMIDFGIGAAVPFCDLMGELMDLIGEDAEALGCVADVERAKLVASTGTSADRQLGVFDAAVEAGRSNEEALKTVVDHLVAETVEGIL